MYLFLDLDPDGYEFFLGEHYVSGDVKDVRDGNLAIIDLAIMSMLAVSDHTETWIPIEESTIRRNTQWKSVYITMLTW